jgi:hypothetical protein
MLILLFLTICLGVSLFMNKRSKNDMFIWFLAEIISGLALIVFLIILPLNRIDHYDQIQKYNAIKMTIEESRKENVSDIERAALINKIADVNKDIASTRYWNDTIFDIYIPDEAAKLEYLK